MIRPGLLASAAGFFGLGILGGQAVGPAPVTGAVALVAGAALVLAGRGRGDLRRSRRLLARGGITARSVEPSPRERVLRAAGFPTGRPTVAPGAPRWAARAACVLAGASLLGLGWQGIRGRPPSLPFAGRTVTFEGSAGSDVHRYDWGWGLQVRVDRARLGPRTMEVDVTAWMVDSGEPPAVEAGDRLRVAGRLEPLGTEGFERFLRTRGVQAHLVAPELRVLGPPGNPALRLANATRRALRVGAERSLTAGHAGLLLGLSIGDVSSMDAEIAEDFRAGGLAHLLAVSGSNVAMFLGPLIALGAAARLRVRGRVVLGVVGVAFFALLTRWEPTVLRAGVMAGVALAASWSGRPRSTMQALSAAVLLLLVADPMLASSPGFQLSVAATAGLAAMGSPIASRLRWLPRWLSLAVASTLAAQAAVTPLLLLSFGMVPTVTILANVLAFPAVAPALLVGIGASLVSLVAPPLGGALGAVAGLPLGYLVAVADRTARFPLPGLTSDDPVTPLVVAGAVVILCLRLRRSHRRLGALVAAGAVGAAGWALVPAAGPPGGLTVTFLDVGQGDAAVVRSPDGAAILVDAGPEERQVATELARLGVRRIDLAVASHGHADHVTGFPAVFARHPVSLLIEPGCPVDSPTYRDMVAAGRAEGIPIRHPRDGDRFRVGDVVVEVLGPERCSPAGEPNDDSLVLRVGFGAASVLFTGDAEVPAQQELLADGDPLTAGVLKVPHHGGDTSIPAFFDDVDAQMAVVSTGPNDYGHPNAGVLAALRRAGMVVFRTDLEGDVTAGFREDGTVTVGLERG